MVDLITPVAAVTVVVLTIFALFQLSKKAKVYKEVMFLRPRDKRGERLDITKETDRSVLCEKSNPVHRFIKVGPAYVFKDGSKGIVRFIGLEGSAYTAQLKDEKIVQVPTVDFLKSLWGNKIYDALPQRMRDAIEKDKIGITIEPVKVNAEEAGLEKLSSDDVNDEGDSVVLNRLAHFGSSENLKQKLLANLVWLGLGAGLYAILQNVFGAMT